MIDIRTSTNEYALPVQRADVFALSAAALTEQNINVVVERNENAPPLRALALLKIMASNIEISSAVADMRVRGWEVTADTAESDLVLLQTHYNTNAPSAVLNEAIAAYDLPASSLMLRRSPTRVRPLPTRKLPVPVPWIYRTIFVPVPGLAPDNLTNLEHDTLVQLMAGRQAIDIKSAAYRSQRHVLERAYDVLGVNDAPCAVVAGVVWNQVDPPEVTTYGPLTQFDIVAVSRLACGDTLAHAATQLGTGLDSVQRGLNRIRTAVEARKLPAICANLFGLGVFAMGQAVETEP